jgi:beta-RFAP synthase
LHFGLLSLAEPEGPLRQFGGVGLMVEAPAVEVEAIAASTWSAEGPEGERALRFVQRAAECLRQEQGLALQPLHLRAWEAPCAHAGLGSGTQLALAAARAATQAWHITATVLDLARWTGRGMRSGLGVHGFTHGGLLVDGGKSSSAGIAPLVARLDFPPNWPIVLAIPSPRCSQVEGLHGVAELDAFARLRAATTQQADALCRLVLLGLLPAAAEQDLRAFGDALFELNRRSGELFAPVQGGPYASPAVSNLVAWLRNQGVRGVGQSSWGPTVFAVVADIEEAAELAVRLETTAPRTGQVMVTAARNLGQFSSR